MTNPRYATKSKPLRDIAKELGVCAEYVRYIEQRALRKLRRSRVVMEFDQPDTPDPWMSPGCRRVPAFDGGE